MRYFAGDHPKKDLKPAQRQQFAIWVREHFGISKQRACRLVMLRRPAFYCNFDDLGQSPDVPATETHRRDWFGWSRK